jgi:hypothetical protein
MCRDHITRIARKSSRRNAREIVSRGARMRAHVSRARRATKVGITFSLVFGEG